MIPNESIKATNISKVPIDELNSRRKKCIEKMQEDGLDCMVFFSPSSVYYLTGWEFFVTERPTAMILWQDGRTCMFIPYLELEHVQQLAQGIDEVNWYPDYPGKRHPMLLLSDILSSRGRIRIGSDSPGSPGFQGYEGPTIDELLPEYELVLMPKFIMELRKIKTPFEISMIKESAKWGNLAMTLLQRYTRPGLRELDVVNRACQEATEAMLATLGQDYIPGGVFWVGAHGNFRGQIGVDSSLPHSLIKNKVFKKGDTLGASGTTYPILGYISEMERTLFLGEPDEKQKKYFDMAVELQEFAVSSVKPGRTCGDVDSDVRNYYKKLGISDYWRHHVGHALGMDRHEPPFLDEAVAEEIRAGMVFSIEPGIYVPGYGGFRHSDTIHVTKDGVELLTYYPRDLESLTIEC